MKSPEPTVVLFGLTHVGVAPASCGFVPMTWIKGIGPRPIGPITERDGAVDRARAYVATYLADDGRGKADVPKPKLSLGRVRCGAIRLAPVSRKLVVTEGLEDGLSLMEGLGLSVWVACGATMLPSMRFPDFVRDVGIGGDNDDAGKANAAQAATAFSERGHGVTTFFPSARFKDFNDELKESRA